MSDPNRESLPSDEENLRKAFEEAAPDLGLRLERPGCGDDTRVVGVAFAIFQSLLEVDLDKAPRAMAGEDDEAIAAALSGYEQADPPTFAKTWRQYAADPHIGMGAHWVGLVDEAAVDHWLGSDELARASRSYPSCTPRRIKISDLRIVYIGGTRASATYHVEEEFENGRRSAGNVSALLFNVKGDGWRIAVITRGGRDVESEDR
jgi:hypothetical protein